MPDVKQMEFGNRLHRIQKHHKKLSRGYVASVNHDGLIIAQPKVKSSGIPLRGIFFCLAAMVLVKAILMANLGDEVYESRVALLMNGTAVERMGAYVMTADPLTSWIASVFEAQIK